MTRIKIATLAAGLGALVGVSTPASAQDTCGETTWDLTAGQTIDVGSITVSNDLDNIYVTYTLDYQNPDCPDGPVDAVFGTLHLWVGDDLMNVDGGGASRPSPGQLPYQSGACSPKGDPGCVVLPSSEGLTTYTFTIPFDELGITNAVDACDTLLYVVPHAEVNYLDCEGNPTGEDDTAFGGPIDPGTPGAWWYYGEYTVCCDFGPPPVGFCNTAYAKGGWVWTTQRRSNPEELPSLELTRNRWGWAINLTEPGETEYEIWRGAGLNNTANGDLVGTLTVDWNGYFVSFCYDLSGYTMQELHVYAGDGSPTTIAPGQYGYTQDFSEGVSSWCDTLPAEDTDGDGVWVVAHAVVCDGGETPCAETPNTVYTEEFIPDPSTYPAQQNWAIGTMVEAASGGEINPWCGNLGGAGELCREGSPCATQGAGYGNDALDGYREYILDISGAIHDVYRMMAYDLGSAKRGFRLYTAIDHWDGTAAAFVNGCCGYNAAFVTADVMEYSVWGYVGPADGSGAATPADLLVNSNWVLLSDVVGFDNTNTLVDGHPSYTFDGVSPAAGAPVTVYINGSLAYGAIGSPLNCYTGHGYSRDYIFCDAYRYIGVRSSTISIGQNDGDPEIDAVFGFDPVQ